VLTVAAEGVAEAGVACAAAGGADAGAGLVVALPDASGFGVAGAAPCTESGCVWVADGAAAAGAALTGAALVGAAVAGTELIGLSPVAVAGSAKTLPAEAASSSATAVEASNRSTRIPGITYSPSRPYGRKTHTHWDKRPQSWHLPL
jgi:hypothetical protein